MVTKKALAQFIQIRKEVDYLHRSVANGRKILKKIEKEGMVADTVTGGYGGRERFRVEGYPYPVYSKTKTQLLQDILRLEKKEAELLTQTKELYDFIDGMEDPIDRMTFNLVYIDGLTQQAAACRLHVDQCTVSRTINKHVNG